MKKLRLVLTLYLEGSTDEDFLGSVIPNVAKSILKNSGQQTVEVAPPKIYLQKDKSDKDLDRNILYVARLVARELHNQHDEEPITYSVLIIHCDADAPNNKKALEDRYLPGYNLVRQSEELEHITLIPVIPVHETESWMLAADHEVLRSVLMTDNLRELDLVDRVHQVASESKPKEKLEQIIQKARGSRSRRRYQVKREDLYEPLGRRISLERLKNVPSYKQFLTISKKP